MRAYFETAKILVCAPVLGHLDARTEELTGIFLELELETFEERQAVGGGAGEADDDAVLDAAHLARVRLHHRMAERDLSIGNHDHLASLSNRKHRGGFEVGLLECEAERMRARRVSTCVRASEHTSSSSSSRCCQRAGLGNLVTTYGNGATAVVP